MARITRVLAALATTAAVAAPAAPAQAAPAAFTFHGVAWEACYGCGATSGGFTGTFTGVADGHVFTDARMTMSFTAETLPAPCFFGAVASGSLTVSDATHTLRASINWYRSYYAAATVTLYGGINGAGTASYVVTQPVGVPCGGPVTVDMRATGVGV
jgi:hypothetical protein